METSVDGNDQSLGQRSFRSPPRRRRSTFFEKLDSLVPQPMSENKEPSVCTKTKMDAKHNTDLMQYYEKLLVEKNEWKKEVNRRRNDYHDVRQQYELAVKTSSGSRISYSALSNEDIEFLKGKVNISQVVESQSKLHKSLRTTQELYKKAMELDNVILNHCEKKLNAITDYILKNSTAEIKD